ncbi:MAG TPA: acyltransferase family protein [Streptosporangiaceae bacterium]|nr:acyltransferase family protein [Streptosporangiaceae bacterium]
MPKPVNASQRYLPGLDGLRALAVLAVIAYHEQFGWAPGGNFGVGVFFTLSGFLITSILLEQQAKRGKILLGDFWLRRARRLLPALFVMLAVATAWITLADRSRLASLRGAVGAAAGYFSNWYLIANHQSYFSRFAPPAPLDHLWSLAVEEQFYLLWPLLLIVGLVLLRKKGSAGSGGGRGVSWEGPPETPRKSAARWLILPTLLLTVMSIYAMAHFYTSSLDPTRVYEGTDTRAFGLLIGAMLAMAWPVGRQIRPGRIGRTVADVAGFAGLAVIFVMIWRVGEYSGFAYHGGLVLLSIATVGVVASTACPGTALGVALGWAPLRWIGARSYGIYLWHYPVIVLTTPVNTKPDLLRAALQIAAAIGLAALSWRFIEEPIRHGAIERLWARARAAGSWTPASPSASFGGTTNFAGLATTAGVAGILVICGVGLSGAVHGPAVSSTSNSLAAAGSLNLPITKTVLHGSPKDAGNTQPAPGSGLPTGPLRTSCRSVAHIGDSTSDGLVSPEYLPNPKQRIVARYEDVGARTVVTDVSGARSIVEVLPGQVNGYDAAKSIIRNGFDGCWVIALGTDDTADVAAGSNYTLAYRIKRMMAVTRGEPVMWVNVKSLLIGGPYAESSMRRWNQALLKACAKYPNMRVYNWASEVRRKWFISDGIHYTSLGYKHRAKDIADALARAFPAGGTSQGCLVSS